MYTCTYCSKKFNNGLLPPSGNICIQCASLEGRLRDEDQELFESFKKKSDGGAAEPASLLSARLLKVFLINIALSIIGTVFLRILDLSYLPFGVLLMTQIIYSLLAFFFALLWLGALNSAIVALDYERVTLHLVLSLLIPLYALVLTLVVYLKLRDKNDQTVKYGRVVLV